MSATDIDRVIVLRAARRTLYALTSALMLAGLAAVLIAPSAREAILLLLPLVPLSLLILITAGVTAAARDQAGELETAARFPQPLELRG